MERDAANHPARIGKYRIDSVLGHGSMGVVYKGYDPVIERVVAIKTIRPELLSGERGAEWHIRFQQEARAAGRCLHPNVVAIFDYGEEEGLPFLAMEYVRGRKLWEHLRTGMQFRPASAVFIINQVLAALGHAHELGIVHRDIKPANIIILDNDGQVKVADFGIARLDTTTLTQSGIAVGTPSYMSPEQFKGAEVDRRSDLYSVGVVLYELLAGRRPFPGTIAAELMYQVFNEQPPPVSQLNVSVPAAIDAVLAKALAREPARRFTSAAAFAKALQEALGGPAAAPDMTLLKTLLKPVSAQGGRAVTSLGSASNLSPAVLHKMEQSLASYIGPLAKVMVKRAVQRASSVGDLCQLLAEHIPNLREKNQFLQWAEIEISGPQQLVMSSARQTVVKALEPAVLDTAQKALTLVIGPIARILVKKAAAEAVSVADLYRRLAQHIADPQERTAFLRGMPKAER